MQDQKLAKVREPVFFKFRKRSILSRRTFETDVLEILQVFWWKLGQNNWLLGLQGRIQHKPENV